jgi:Zinc knuckle
VAFFGKLIEQLDLWNVGLRRRLLTIRVLLSTEHEYRLNSDILLEVVTGNLFFNQDIKGNISKQKADTNKSNGNARWWRTNKRKDPNAMDVDTLTMEERGMLLRQGKCFRCKKTGHMAKDCPPEQGESSKKKVDLARFAYTTIKALTKEQREKW